jgi:hypothetical protein
LCELLRSSRIHRGRSGGVAVVAKSANQGSILSFPVPARDLYVRIGFFWFLAQIFESKEKEGENSAASILKGRFG